MKVLHWYPNFQGGGGVASAVLGLSQAQANLGAEVAIATAAAEGPPLYQDMTSAAHVTMFRWQPKGCVRWRALKLRRIGSADVQKILDFRPQVIHVHGEFNPDNLWVPHMFRGAVLVLSPHGAFHPAVLTKSSVVVKRVYLSLARRVLYRCVDACHALSPAEADHIGALLGGVRVYTAPQGTNPHMGAAWGAEGKTRERKDCVRFVCVGRLDVYTKGLDILVEAFSAAIRRIGHERLQLTMVGPDWRGGRDWLNKKAKALGVGHLVRFTSGVPTRGVAEHLGESDVYIQLSRHDGFPLAVAEGLCAGKPAILSREIGTVSYPEISCLSHVRIVCPELENVVSTILEFSENVDRLTKQAWSAREEVRRFFDWRRSAQKHLDEYEALCQSARPASHG